MTRKFTKEIPGKSIASISKQGQIYKLVEGITNKETLQPCTETTIFGVASLSKVVFAAIVLKAIETGLFSRSGELPEKGIDRPLCEFSEFGPPHLREHPNYKILTTRMILSHQSGLPNWFAAGKPEDYETKAGENFHYSGLAFCFLKDALEQSSGKSLEQLAQELFSNKKFQMHNSSFFSPEEGSERRKNYAIGHFADGKIDKREHFPKKYGPNPAASLFTTVVDYAKFLKGCLNDPFLRKHMFESQIDLVNTDEKGITKGVPATALECIHWGLGIGLQKIKDGPMIAFHWGDAETSRAFAAINLDTEQATVCVTNSENGPLIFRQSVEPSIGDLSAVFHWLARRENLKLFPECKITESLSKLTLFKKLEDEFLSEHRHDDPKLQHEYDKRFGLVLKR